MKIKKIEFKNIGSYGNILQTISFDDTGSFYLLMGQNGHGKSQISKAIIYGLYGKLDKHKLSDIPNRFNKQLYIRITIDKNGVDYVITRTSSPNTLTVKVGDNLYDQANKKDVQQYIEDEIIGLSFYVFTNIISLSINDFVSFLDMGVSDKRNIIDKIFSLDILNTVKWQLNYEKRQITSKIQNIESEIKIFIDSINSTKREYEKLKSQLEDKKTIETESLNEKLKSTGEEINQLNIILEKHSVKKAELTEKYREFSSIYNSHSNSLYNIEQKLDVYSKGKCPTCSSDLTTDIHSAIADDLKNKKKLLSDEISELKEKMAKYEDVIKKSGQKIKDANAMIQKCNGLLNTFHAQLSKVTENDSTMQIDSLRNIIKNALEEKKIRDKTRTVELQKSELFKDLEDIFSEKGVKQLALKKILPSLNKLINQSLIELNLEYKLNFNLEFEPIITHMGVQISPNTLSTGEKKKLDFSVIIAIIKLLKLKFPGINLLFLDEIFSSLDADAIHQVLKILTSMCKEYNLNTFVINHSPLPLELFDYKCEAIKKNGFSNLTIEKTQ